MAEVGQVYQDDYDDMPALINDNQGNYNNIPNIINNQENYNNIPNIINNQENDDDMPALIDANQENYNYISNLVNNLPDLDDMPALIDGNQNYIINYIVPHIPPVFEEKPIFINFDTYDK
jgi:hypothetical protein